MNVTHKWKRFIAVGCSHGEYLDDGVKGQLFEFMADFKPDTRIHLGDAWDTTAFRAGAAGSSDEGASISSDIGAGQDFLEEYEPDLFFMGNHEDRLYKLLDHPKEIIRFAANRALDALKASAGRTAKEIVEYSHIASPCSWRVLGDTAFGHGFIFNMNYCRDTVEYLGMSCVVAHGHKVMMQPGRCLGAPCGYSVGTLSSIPAMAYAKTKRATSAWSAGWAYGEYSEESCQILLKKVKSDETAAKIPTFKTT